MLSEAGTYSGKYHSVLSTVEHNTRRLCSDNWTLAHSQRSFEVEFIWPKRMWMIHRISLPLAFIAFSVEFEVFELNLLKLIQVYLCAVCLGISLISILYGITYHPFGFIKSIRKWSGKCRRPNLKNRSYRETLIHTHSDLKIRSDATILNCWFMCTKCVLLLASVLVQNWCVRTESRASVRFSTFMPASEYDFDDITVWK